MCSQQLGKASRKKGSALDKSSRKPKEEEKVCTKRGKKDKGLIIEGDDIEVDDDLQDDSVERRGKEGKNGKAKKMKVKVKQGQQSSSVDDDDEMIITF